jgi:hypothetical protein
VRLPISTAAVLATVGMAAAVFADTHIEPSAQYPVIAGHNIYAPFVIEPEGSDRRIMFFGGWLGRSDFPHDRIYECDLDDGVGTATRCKTPRTVVSPDDLPVQAMHINNPAITYIPQLGRYLLAATVCAGACESQKQSQIWVGTAAVPEGAWKLKALLDNGAAEPTIGEISQAGDRATIIYALRGDMNALHAQIIDPGPLAKIGPSTVYLVDPGRHAVTNPSYSEIADHHLLLWNRLTGRQDAALGRVVATGVEVAMAIARQDGGWSPPRTLLTSDSHICAYLTPSAAENPDGSISIFTGIVRRTETPWCRLAGNASEIRQFVYPQSRLLETEQP